MNLNSVWTLVSLEDVPNSGYICINQNSHGVPSHQQGHFRLNNKLICNDKDDKRISYMTT